MFFRNKILKGYLRAVRFVSNRSWKVHQANQWVRLDERLAETGAFGFLVHRLPTGYSQEGEPRESLEGKGECGLLD